MDMKKLLAATAVAALVAGTNLAAAQSVTTSPSGASKSGPSAPSSTSPTGAARDDAGTPGVDTKPAPQRTGQTDMKKGATPNNAQKSDPSQSGDNKPGARDAQKSTQSEPSGPGETKKGQRAGSSTSEKSATAGGGSGTLTSEKRTRIKQTIVKSGKAPRVNNVNFSISVGTTVPRSVTLVAVPSTVIEIYPAWRGYEYFIADDEIVIVDPDTMQIIAVLPA